MSRQWKQICRCGALFCLAATTISCGGNGGGGDEDKTQTDHPISVPLSLDLKVDSLSSTPSMALSSDTASAKLSKVSDTDFQATIVNGAGESINMWLDTANSVAVMRDTSDGGTLVVARLSDVTTTVIYAGDGSFVSGALKYSLGGQVYVAPMISETDTDPRDHVSEGIALPVHADPSILKSGQAASSVLLTQRTLATSLNDSDSCYGFITGLSSEPADYAEEAADTLDEVGSSKRVSKVAKLLSTIWSKAASLCSDAPGDSVGLNNDAAYVIAVYDQALGGNWSDTLDQVSTLRHLTQLIEEGVTKAKTAIANGLASTSESVGALPPVGLTGTAAEVKSQVDVGKVYFAQVNCVTNGVLVPVVSYDPNGYLTSFKYRAEFPNVCGYSIQLAYCTSTATGGAVPPRCTPYLRDDLAAGQTWTNLGRETESDTEVVLEDYTFIQCPLFQDGRNVFLDTSKIDSACYYYK